REATTPRTHSILNDRVRNRGVAFSVRERAELGLTGRLPPAVLTLDQQAERAYSQLRAMPAGDARKLYLEHLHDRNETLYFTVLSGHPAELLPLVADPLVSDGIGPSSPQCYSPDGVYLSIDRPGDIEKSFATLGLGAGDVDIIVCSDGEEIPGIGDGGVGGIGAAAGKLAIYTAAGGIRPRRMIPVSLDAGTDNQALRGDPFYLGSRRARRRGQDYHAFIGRYVQTVSRLFPGALLHFEAIDPETARQILHAYGRGYRVFSDVQGTGAVVLAAVYAGIRVTGIPMRYQTVVAFGAGATGVAITDQLRDAMVADGATEEQARSQIWLVGTPAPVGLTETVDQAAPTILLGTSAVEGAFNRPVIEAMCRATSRPLILPVWGPASGPASTAEAAPSDVIAWSGGRALVATGSAGHDGATLTIRQAGSFLVGPGLGLGVMVSGASRVTPRMLRAAAAAIAEQADASQPGAPLLPVVRDLRASSATLAEAVVRAAVADGVAVFNPTNPAQAVQDAMWRPAYPDLRQDLL
ncbi:MAG TPA: oxaloacetate-decarboxylating malate dehydrogenase, partial [Streptosporangiaceae bacterium]|nr:oxaloacetate-decarboxylating malate dehydrogenase [Streptosporangiaceae bacterium]